MKKTHAVIALLLAAIFVLTLAPAQAAVDRTKAPKVTLAAPESEITSGSTVVLQLTADLPGFVTLYLYDFSGSQVLTVCQNREFHTKENTLTFSLVDAERKPIPAGTYTISGEAQSQFGVSASVEGKTLTVAQAIIPDEPEEAQGASQTSSGSASTSSSSAASSGAQPITYSAAEPLSVGEEGLQIGVGPSDVAQQSDAGYWALTADASDEEIWAALTRPMWSVGDIDERESAYIYDSPYEGRSRLGTVSGLSQGLNVVAERSDGWVLIEAFRNEDGAFVRGYIQQKRLRSVEPNTTYGLVIDKNTQMLTVFRNGQRVGSCPVTTGLANTEYPHRETPAGEFVTVTRHGTVDYANGRGYCAYAVRINGNYRLCEIPSTKKGGSDFSQLEGALGVVKSTRGDIAIAHAASVDGGINAKWIWDMTGANKKVKVLIFDDKDRSQVPDSK